MQGVDDALQDGDQLYRIIVLEPELANRKRRRSGRSSNDPEYNGIASNIAVFNVNIDNEANPGGNRADVLINPTSGLPPTKVVWLLLSKWF